jgi:protocatechuate 3,4-dioxygenase beta subunit
MLLRSDIRPDPSDGSVRAGLPLELTLVVSQVSSQGCAPLAGATIDVWHCDALGVYSDVDDAAGSTLGQKFLRGLQISDAGGAIKFTTIYPGWYPGRAVHIHFKIRTDLAAASGREFSSQLFFPDALSEQIYTQQPYAAKGQGFRRNAEDGIYNSGGDQLLLDPSPTDQGCATTFSVGLQLD